MIKRFMIIENSNGIVSQDTILRKLNELIDFSNEVDKVKGDAKVESRDEAFFHTVLSDLRDSGARVKELHHENEQMLEMLKVLLHNWECSEEPAKTTITKLRILIAQNDPKEPAGGDAKVEELEAEASERIVHNAAVLKSYNHLRDQQDAVQGTVEAQREALEQIRAEAKSQRPPGTNGYVLAFWLEQVCDRVLGDKDPADASETQCQHCDQVISSMGQNCPERSSAIGPLPCTPKDPADA